MRRLRKNRDKLINSIPTATGNPLTEILENAAYSGKISGTVEGKNENGKSVREENTYTAYLEIKNSKVKFSTHKEELENA